MRQGHDRNAACRHAAGLGKVTAACGAKICGRDMFNMDTCRGGLMSIGLLAFLAFIPILIALILMAGMRWPSTRAMPIAWLAGVVLAFAFWGQEPLRLLALSIEGAITAVGVLIIVFGALLIYYTMQYSGAMETIQAGMKKISPDKRLQTIIIGFMFAAFIEGAAGFGTPAGPGLPAPVRCRYLSGLQQRARDLRRRGYPRAAGLQIHRDLCHAGHELL
jgi:hypothetical protein